MSVRGVAGSGERGAIRVTPVGVAVPTAGFANANVGFPDGLANQDSGERGAGKGRDISIAKTENDTSRQQRLHQIGKQIQLDRRMFEWNQIQPLTV
jgi:hypothetical protein